MRLLGRGRNDGMEEGLSLSRVKSSQAAATITTLGMTKAQAAERERAIRNVIMRIGGAAGWWYV